MFSTVARRLTAAGLTIIATTALTLVGPSAFAGESTEWGIKGSTSRTTNGGGSTEWGLNGGGSTEWGLNGGGSTEWGLNGGGSTEWGLNGGSTEWG
jgi:hypothetical protein